MPLEPLGHKDPLLPPSSLGQSFQPQQSLLPLGQSLTPLGQHLQSPLPNASFPGTEIPTSMSSFSEPMGANTAFADRTTARITSESNRETQPSVSSAPIGDIPNLGSNSFESQAGNPPTVSGRWQEDEFAPDASNTPSFSSPNTAAENLVSRKPLGLSKPLAQESDFLTSPFTAEFLEQPRTSSQQIATASPETPVSKPLVVQGRLETQLPPDLPPTAVEIAKPSVEPVSSNSEAIASPPLPTGSERTSEASTSSKSTIVQPSLETKTSSPTNLALTSSLTEASREDSGAILPQSAPEVPESRPSQATDSQPTVVQPRLETGNSAPTQQIAQVSSPTEISAQESEPPTPQSAPEVPESRPLQATHSQPTVVQPRLQTEPPAPTNLAATWSPTETSTQEREAPAPPSAPEVPESRPSQATDSQLTVVQSRLETETPAPTNLAATSLPTEISTQETEAPAQQSALQLPEPKPSTVTDSQPTVVQPRLETETPAPTQTLAPAEQQGELASDTSAALRPKPAPQVPARPSQATDLQPTQPRLETETPAPTNLAATSSPIETSTQESEAPVPQPTVVQLRLETETPAPINLASTSSPTETSTQESEAPAPPSAPEVSESRPQAAAPLQPAVVQPYRETETSTSTPTFEPAALQGEASSQQRQVSTSQSVSGVSESPAPEVTDSVPNVVQPHREMETSTLTPNIAPASPPIEASTQDSEAPIPPLAPQVPNSRPSEATDSQPTVVQARREAETAAPTPNIAPASPLTDTSKENSDAIALKTAPEVPESTPPQVTDSQIAPVQPRLETETSALTTIVQPRLDKESLPLLNPLGLSKPLAQQSDFFTSGLLAEFLGKQPTSPQEIPETPSGRSSTEPAQSPDVKVPSSLSTTGSQPSRVPSAPVRDVPDSWSSLSELLGESSTATADSRSRSWEDEFASLVKMDGESSRSEAIANSQESVTLGTDNRASSPGTTPISISSPATSTQPTADKEREDSIEEQLEILAQKIYSLIRQRLEIDKERQGHYCTGHPPWLDTLDPKSSNTASSTSARSPQTAGQLTASLNGEVSSLDGKLEILTQEVYNLLRLRLEIERERQNIYY